MYMHMQTCVSNALARMISGSACVHDEVHLLGSVTDDSWPGYNGLSKWADFAAFNTLGMGCSLATFLAERPKDRPLGAEHRAVDIVAALLRWNPQSRVDMEGMGKMLEGEVANATTVTAAAVTSTSRLRLRRRLRLNKATTTVAAAAASAAAPPGDADGPAAPEEAGGACVGATMI